MLNEDFHSFYRMFYHTQMLTKYSMNFVTDSIFSILHLRDPKNAAVQLQPKIDSQRKLKAAEEMEKAIKDEIENAITMLN